MENAPSREPARVETAYDRLLLREGVTYKDIVTLEHITEEPQWGLIINHETFDVTAAAFSLIPDSDKIRVIPYQNGEPTELAWDWHPADLGLCPRRPGGIIKADNRVFIPPTDEAEKFH